MCCVILCLIYNKFNDYIFKISLILIYEIQITKDKKYQKNFYYTYIFEIHNNKWLDIILESFYAHSSHENI